MSDLPDLPNPIDERLQQIHDRLNQIREKVGHARAATEISGNRTVVGHYIDDVSYLLTILKSQK